MGGWRGGPIARLGGGPALVGGLVVAMLAMSSPPSGPVHAASGPTLTLIPARGLPDAELVVSGTGMAPGADVTVVDDTAAASVCVSVADGMGAFTCAGRLHTVAGAHDLITANADASSASSTYIAYGRHTIGTIAQDPVGNNGPATDAYIGYPGGVARDRYGNLFLVDSNAHQVRKVSSTGVITAFAGSGFGGFAGDGGPAKKASFNAISAVTVDTAGNVYVSDSANHRVRRIAKGVVTTVVGNGTFGSGGDGGPATGAQVVYVDALAVDSAGNLYLADGQASRVRRVDGITGIITTVAGTGTSGYFGDGGAATAAALDFPEGLCFDSAGNLYIAGATAVRKVNTAGIISTFAGSNVGGFGGDGGPATSARLYYPNGLTMDRAGNLYISDGNNRRIRKIDSSGIITTVAGTGAGGFTGDGGPASSATIDLPSGLASDPAGTLFISDRGNARIRRVDVGGTISTIAGIGRGAFAGDGGTLDSLRMAIPDALAVNGAGDLFVADILNLRVRRIAHDGTVSTVAGNGVDGFSGDGGPAVAASLSEVQALAVDPSGNLFIADTYNQRVRRVDAATGVITTIAGNGSTGAAGDGGPAPSAELNYPWGLATDRAGDVFISDQVNNKVRRVDAHTGIITTYAGNGTPDFYGDGGPATAAAIYRPVGIATDGKDNLYIADSSNQRIRKVTPTGTISTWAGTGTCSRTGDGGPATAATLCFPLGLATDTAGNLYVADGNNIVIRKVTRAGIISTYAGDGQWGVGGDGGLATNAEFGTPRSVAVDPSGYLYLTDAGRNAIRQVVP